LGGRFVELQLEHRNNYVVLLLGHDTNVPLLI